MAGKSPVTASEEQKVALEALASPRDRGEAGRARAILLTLERWSSTRIAEVFRVRREASNVTLLVRHASRTSAFGLLEQGRIDMAAGNFPDAKPPLASQELFTDDLVCALRQDHPALSAAWSLDHWLSLDHLNVSLAGEPQGYVDEILARQGLRRRIKATIGHFLLAPHLLARTDLVATEPRGVLEHLASRLGLVLRPLPFDAASFSVSLVWHARIRDDDGYRWLQTMMTGEGRRYPATAAG